MIDERLNVLLDGYLDGALSAEEKKELERMLLESDAARRQFWERASLHGWTYAAAKLNYSARQAEEVAQERRQLGGVSMEAFLRWLRRASRFGWKIALAGAACIVGLMLWNRFHQVDALDEDELTTDVPAEPAATNGIATLTRETGVVWGTETNNLEAGSQLSAGWLQLKSGVIEVEFDSGARVILEGPADLQLISPTEARLRSGRISAHVPEPAHGFKVYTPDATVTDLGTEFGVDREASRPMKIEVFEGKVEVVVDATNEPRLLNAGEGLRISSHHAEPLVAVDHTEFLSAEELARRESAELRTRYQGWKQVDRMLDSDTAVLVHLNFEDQRSLDQNLINRAGGMRASGQAMIFGCDWVDGRWPGKGALQFSRATDKVRLIVPGQFQSLSYVAWVRVDSLPNAWNALALVDTFKTGETHWQLHRNGSMELSVRPIGGKSGWDRLLSRPIITHGLLGHWIQLAAVYDGNEGRMNLYLNGRQVATKLAKWRQPLTLGTLELGNWSPTAARAGAGYRFREFHGRMDEFTLLSRPLSSEEIRWMYEFGKPRETLNVAKLNSGNSAPP
jgi:ferric-dicitrate binding protein FerR (iron transport regulator)